MNILLTGGAGYIGSHTAVALSQMGFNPVLLDNFSNSKKNVINGLNKILGKDICIVQGNILDAKLVAKTLKDFNIDLVIHFAALKAVGESVSYPLKYYSNNVGGTISLLEGMEEAGVRRLVFSSSATVYGLPQYLPINEDHPCAPQNPYGRTKLFIETILEDLAAANSNWRIVSLRYFNPVGAHQSGYIGEDPNGVPNNLMPFLIQVAQGVLNKLLVYGNDYPTKDGTGERDFIHVMDLALGHLAAVDYLQKNTGHHVFNLGTGHPSSVLDVVNCFQELAGIRVPFKFSCRRSGDLAVCYADVDKAKRLLMWESSHSLVDMISSAWSFACKNFADKKYD